MSANIIPAKIYYDRDREHYLNIARDYYNNNREHILKKARDKYNNLEEDKNKRIEYGKRRYHNRYNGVNVMFLFKDSLPFIINRLSFSCGKNLFFSHVRILNSS